VLMLRLRASTKTGQAVLTFKHHLHSVTTVKKSNRSLSNILEESVINHQIRKKMFARTSTAVYLTMRKAELFVSPKK